MSERLKESSQIPADMAALRKRAEEKAKTMEAVSLSAHTPEEIQRILHELTVHQIELEMQNDELRKAQVQIEAGRARYFDLYDLAPVGYCTIDEKGIILETNITLATMLGVDRQIMMQKPFSAFILNEDQDVFYLLRKQFTDTEKPQACELRMVRNDSITFWALLKATEIQDEDGANYLRMIVSDCSQQKMAQQKLRESEGEMKEYAYLLEVKNQELDVAAKEADKANQAKSRYLAHMNHEIRTPLNGFIGFLQLMEDTGLNEEQQEFMYYIKLSTNHMLSIINNVLDYAKIESGGLQLENCSFNLEQEIETALAPLRSLARQKNLHLEVTMDKNLPQQVKGDADRLRQIILNLGGNAVKFTWEGRVHVAARCPETTQDHHILQLVVEDTGPGMNQETLESLFQPFYQADDGTKRQSKGTGLGMAITQELVDRMSGEIHVDSTLGEGTKVEVNVKLIRLEK